MIRFGISEWRQQMFKIIIPILVIALAAFVGMNAKSGLIRGVADGMLVSPARPAVAVKPAADFASAATASGRGIFNIVRTFDNRSYCA